MRRPYDPWKLEDEEETPGVNNTRVRHKLPPDNPKDALPLNMRTMEWILMTGSTAHDMEQGYKALTLRAFPATLLAVIHDLAQEMRVRTGKRWTEASVFRLLTKLGASWLAAPDHVRLLDHGAASVCRPYILCNSLFKTTGRKWRTPVHVRVHRLLSYLGGIFNLPIDQVAALSIIAAIGCSVQYVAPRIVMTCRNEIYRLVISLLQDLLAAPALKQWASIDHLVVAHWHETSFRFAEEPRCFGGLTLSSMYLRFSPRSRS